MKSANRVNYIVITAMISLIFVLSCSEDDPTGSGNHPPYQPYSPFPTNASSGRSVDSDLYWRCEDVDGDALDYTVYFSDSESLQVLATDYADTFYALDPLATNTTYYWQIVAHDIFNDSTTGPLWRFTTADTVNLPPDTPSYPSPANNLTGLPLSLNLTWSCSDPNIGDFLRYGVYFDTLPSPAQPPAQVQTELYNPGTLEPNTQYYWKVVAYDNLDDSTAGPVWTFSTGDSVNGVFAAMTVTRMFTHDGDSILRTDEIVARFDSAYAPYEVITPLEAEGVMCNAYSLSWDNDLGIHRYTDIVNLSFLELSETYIFEIGISSTVPAFVNSIIFPDTETFITEPNDEDTIALDGFTVSWNGSGSDSVMLKILEGSNTTAVSVTAANDGSYSFTTDDLAPLGGQAGNYEIMLIYQKEKLISAAGYDSRSYIRARMISTIDVYME